MSSDKEYMFSKESITAAIENPQSSFQKVFKESVIAMIASNKNELLWYVNFLSRCEYEFHFNESFVSSLYFNGKHFVIAINPAILSILHTDEVIAILKHSAGHIINHHLRRGLAYSSVDKDVVQTAKDIVINGSQDVPYIKDLPRSGVYRDSPVGTLFYETLKEKYTIESYEVGREFEYYIELMLNTKQEEASSCSNDLESEEDDELDFQSESSDERDENSKPSEDEADEDAQNEGSVDSESFEEGGEQSEASDEGEEDDSDEENTDIESLAQRTLESLRKGECSLDSHEFGEQLQESVGLDDATLESFMDTTLQEMMQSSTEFARGFTPSEASESLTKIEKRKAHKDWRRVFNKRVRNHLTNSTRYRHPNKSRQHPIYPDDLDLYGYSPAKKPKIGVVLDISGSVDDALLSALMSEVQAIQRKYAIKSVTLVQVDAEVKTIEKFGVRDKFVARAGSGGTVMEPGFKALLKQSSRNIPEIIICATDGEIEARFSEVKLPSKLQVIWLLPKGKKLMFDTSAYPKHQMSVVEFF
ncbi:MAG: hypothetical protein JXQ67_07010 [Campylobacterales bacterium]|nr:hypothetical protein [Campylobacterales bacterium]